MTFGSEVLHKLEEEILMLFKFVTYLLKVFHSAGIWKHADLIIVDQSAELLNYNKDLRNEIANFSFSPAEHWLVKHLVQEIVVNLNEVFKDLDAAQAFRERPPLGINGVDHEVLLEGRHKGVHGRP